MKKNIFIITILLLLQNIHASQKENTRSAFPLSYKEVNNPENHYKWYNKKNGLIRGFIPKKICLLMDPRTTKKTIKEAIKEYGANPFITDDDGNTVLHHAVKNSKPLLVEFYLKLGVDPLQENNSGEIPFDLIKHTSYFKKGPIKKLLLPYNNNNSNQE